MGIIFTLRRSIGLPILNTLYLVSMIVLIAAFVVGGVIGAFIVGQDSAGLGFLWFAGSVLYAFFGWLSLRLTFEVVAAIFRIALATERSAELLRGPLQR